MLREAGGSHVNAAAVRVCKENVNTHSQESDQVPPLGFGFAIFFLFFYICISSVQQQGSVHKK
jgi:hypothetical protein